MDRALLDSTLAAAGEPDYRAAQVWQWVAGGARSYEEMTNLPVDLRETLAAELPLSTLALETEAHSRDGTEKALFQTAESLLEGSAAGVLWCPRSAARERAASDNS